MWTTRINQNKMFIRKQKNNNLENIIKITTYFLKSFLFLKAPPFCPPEFQLSLLNL